MSDYLILSDSLPQPAYQASVVKQNEPKLAAKLHLDLYHLMQKAGAAAFACLQQHFSEAHTVLVVCGKGNNGGDGFELARLAYQQNYQVNILQCVAQEQITAEALQAKHQLQKSGVNCYQVTDAQQLAQYQPLFNCDLIVDALLGIGLTGAVRDFYQTVITAINQANVPVLSLDLPSGLNADTGCEQPVAVKAQTTITFIALKQGLVTAQAANVVGTLYFADLGMAQAFQQQVPAKVWVQGAKALPKLSERQANTHKGVIGLTLAIGGNIGMPGAIRLASEAALRCGSSLVGVACHHHNQALVFAGRPELMLATDQASELLASPMYQKAKSLIIGPGLGRNDWAKQFLPVILADSQDEKIRVIDADALWWLAQCQQQAKLSMSHTVITPHVGEAAKLLGCTIADIERDRYHAVRELAKRYQAICVLKGAGSLISDGDTVWVNSSGNAGMATGGMGDVLSGIIAALALQMPNLIDATRLAVFLHGKAADIIARESGQCGILASDLFTPLQKLVNKY